MTVPKVRRIAIADGGWRFDNEIAGRVKQAAERLLHVARTFTELKRIPKTIHVRDVAFAAKR